MEHPGRAAAHARHAERRARGRRCRCCPATTRSATCSSSVGAPFREREARQLIAEFPGFIQLQAGLLNDRLAAHAQSRWKELAVRRPAAAPRVERLAHRGLQRRTHRVGRPAAGACSTTPSQLRKELDQQRERHVERGRPTRSLHRRRPRLPHADRATKRERRLVVPRRAEPGDAT